MKAAVITARGGSKRIPRKNILEFYGKPMIAWSIDQAIKAKVFDRVIVSTDDDQVASIAKKYGAEVPFIRPSKLADDFATTTDVMEHATAWLDNDMEGLKSLCCIYPTAPFLVAQDIIDGYKSMLDGDWSYAFSATDFDPTVFRAFTQNKSGGVKMIFDQFYETRSQDLPSVMYDAAQFYWGKKEAWLNRMSLFSPHSLAVKIPCWRVVDIDTMDDLKRASAIAPEVYRRLSE